MVMYITQFFYFTFFLEKRWMINKKSHVRQWTKLTEKRIFNLTSYPIHGYLYFSFFLFKFFRWNVHTTIFSSEAFTYQIGRRPAVWVFLAVRSRPPPRQQTARDEAVKWRPQSSPWRAVIYAHWYSQTTTAAVRSTWTNSASCLSVRRSNTVPNRTQRRFGCFSFEISKNFKKNPKCASCTKIYTN